MRFTKYILCLSASVILSAQSFASEMLSAIYVLNQTSHYHVRIIGTDTMCHRQIIEEKTFVSPWIHYFTLEYKKIGSEDHYKSVYMPSHAINGPVGNFFDLINKYYAITCAETQDNDVPVHCQLTSHFKTAEQARKSLEILKT